MAVEPLVVAFNLFRDDEDEAIVDEDDWFSDEETTLKRDSYSFELAWNFLYFIKNYFFNRIHTFKSHFIV